jgi:hypothetical protein
MIRTFHLVSSLTVGVKGREKFLASQHFSLKKLEISFAFSCSTKSLGGEEEKTSKSFRDNKQDERGVGERERWNF